MTRVVGTTVVHYLRRGRGVVQEITYYAWTPIGAAYPAVPSEASTEPSSSWSTTPITPSADEPCVWIFKRIQYNADPIWETTTPAVFAVYVTGAQGADGDSWTDIDGIYKWSECVDGKSFYAKSSTHHASVVYYGGYYWCCILDHTKSSSTEPSASSKYWEQYEYLRLFSTGSLISDEILMTDDDGNIVFKAAGGSVECNTGTFKNVDVSGKVTSGAKNGQRVELDPDEMAMSIFNSSNAECAMFSGAEYSEDTLFPSMSDGTATLNSTYKSYSRTASASANNSYNVTSVFQLSASGTVRVNISRLTASLTYDKLSSDATKSFSQPVARVKLVLQKYTDSTCLVTDGSSKQIAVADVVGEKGSYSLSAQTATKSAAAGYYKILALCEFEPGTSTSFSGTLAWTVLAVTYTTDVWNAKYFANGVCLSKSKDDYFLAMLQNSQMTAAMVSGGIGIRVYGGKLQVKATASGSWQSLDLSKLVSNNS